MSVAVFAQNKVSGTIKTENGSPIPGVNVVVKGTTTGTTSGNDGTYTEPWGHRWVDLRRYDRLNAQNVDISLDRGNIFK